MKAVFKWNIGFSVFPHVFPWEPYVPQYNKKLNIIIIARGMNQRCIIFTHLHPSVQEIDTWPLTSGSGIMPTVYCGKYYEVKLDHCDTCSEIMIACKMNFIFKHKM